MISDAYKSIFVQIPKNAGSSIVKSLGASNFRRVNLSREGPHWDNGGYKVGTARRLRQLHDDIWRDYFKFTFVRNPWDRMVSSWSWLTKTGKVKRMGFRKFVMSYPFRHPGADWHSLPQHVHICDENGRSLVDFVGRFENLDSDFEKVCNKVGVKYRGPLPHIKKTKHKPYWEYYSNSAVERCANIFRKDIELFGYKFRQ